MKYLLGLLRWMLKAAVFFTLFAFALNNQENVTLRFFFGTSWQAPLVLVVLAVFAVGVAIGALGMVPRWWMHRQAARRQPSAPPSVASAAPAPATSPELPPHGI